MRNIVINVSWQLDSGLQASEKLSKRGLHLINFKYIFHRLLPLGDSLGFNSCIFLWRPQPGALNKTKYQDCGDTLLLCCLREKDLPAT